MPLLPGFPLKLTVVSYQNGNFSSKLELPCLPPSSLELWRRERASRQLSFWWKTLILIGHYYGIIIWSKSRSLPAGNLPVVWNCEFLKLQWMYGQKTCIPEENFPSRWCTTSGPAKLQMCRAWMGLMLTLLWKYRDFKGQVNIVLLTFHLPCRCVAAFEEILD